MTSKEILIAELTRLKNSIQTNRNTEEDLLSAINQFIYSGYDESSYLIITSILNSIL